MTIRRAAVVEAMYNAVSSATGDPTNDWSRHALIAVDAAAVRAHGSVR